MKTYVCDNVFIPLRRSPSHKSEMSSQLLFGERFSIEEEAGDWLRVRTVFDDYSGWIDGTQTEMPEAGSDTDSRVLNRALRCYRADGSKLILEAGSEIYSPDFSNNTFILANETYSTSDSFSPSFVTVNESRADTAMRFLNSPYIWGGRIPSGTDCSGFTQMIYKIHGIGLPRDSNRQVQEGTAVSFLEEARPGDLLFFGDEAGNINHVALLLSKGLAIHASGRVRIDPVDQTGIYRRDMGRYSHRLRTIIRVADKS